MERELPISRWRRFELFAEWWYDGITSWLSLVFYAGLGLITTSLLGAFGVLGDVSSAITVVLVGIGMAIGTLMTWFGARKLVAHWREEFPHGLGGAQEQPFRHSRTEGRSVD